MRHITGGFKGDGGHPARAISPPQKIVKIKFNHTPPGKEMYNLRVLILPFGN